MGMLKGSKMRKAYEQLQLGMSKDEVMKIFGKPNSQKMRDGAEVYTWWSQEWKGALRGGSMERRIVVEFQDSKVIGFDGENVDRTSW